MRTGTVSRKRFALALVMAAAALGAGCSIQKPTDEEKAVLITVRDFEQYGLGPSAAPDKYERFTKMSFLSDDISLQYTYQPPESEDSVKYLTELLQLRKKPSPGGGSGSIQESIVKKVFSSQKITLREEETGFAYGKRTKVFTILNEAGFAAGSYVSIGDERLECVFMIVGVLVNEEDVLEELFREKLDAAKELFTRAPGRSGKP